MIIFIIYITFSSVNLCDDGGLTLMELKTNLEIEISKLQNAINMKRLNYDSYMELMDISRPNFRNFSQEKVLKTNISCWRAQMHEALDKIHQLERHIKSKDIHYICMYKSQ
jgi:hypothetical protein